MSQPLLRVSELDFDTIKTNLKDFLRSRSEFTDYDFEGAGLSVLIKLLAYNTHYEALIANQIAQELTIDTARNSTIVGLHAKRLGYTPRSYTAARTLVNLEVIAPTGNPDTLTIGKGASFISSTDGHTVNFTNLVPTTISKDSQNRYIFENIEIFQGTTKTFRYIYSEQYQNKFEIPDGTVDTSTLRVYIQKSQTNTSRLEYFKVDRITDVKSNSLAYYLQVNKNGKYEVVFGDGVLGKKPEDGNVIILDYIITDGKSGNDVRVFSFNDYIEGNTNVVMTVKSKSYGGDDAETIDSIRFNAYRNTITQDRAVTETDYENVISSFFPLDSISVWGGERNAPPSYGKVFISIKPINSDSVLTDTNKQDIIRTLKTSKSIVTISPEFVDVDYLYIHPTVTVYIDDTKINTTTEFIKTLVTSAIKNFSSTTLEKFDKVFRFSKFSNVIDKTDSAIVSNISYMRIAKRFSPYIGVVDSWNVHFDNPLTPGSISSTTFRMQETNDLDLYMVDSNGSIDIIYTENNVKKILYTNIGTVNYSTGSITISAVMFQSYGDYIEITGTPASPDIISMRNSLLLIDSSKIKVSTVIESQNLAYHQFTVVR